MPSSSPAAVGRERHDLAAAQRLVGVSRCLAVHADVAVGDLHQPVRLAGHDRQRPRPGRRTGPARSPAGPAVPGPDRSALAAAMATEPSNVLTVRRNASTRPARRRASRDTSAGMTLASVVIGDGMASAARARDRRGCRRRR